MKRYVRNLISNGKIKEVIRMRKKVNHAGQMLFQTWLSEEEMLKAKLLASQYGITLAGLVRLIINQPYGTVYVKPLDRREISNENGI